MHTHPDNVESVIDVQVGTLLHDMYLPVWLAAHSWAHTQLHTFAKGLMTQGQQPGEGCLNCCWQT